ncbi:N-formylglutamate amidohydrolase [Rhodoblastus sp.]|uniref:N-formylglutamate amidohydrolase n=1 Tax=Rhodoblastus sp. TaxID=1962975 RepID=UPI0035ADEC22
MTNLAEVSDRASPSCETFEPASLDSPLVFSSPHSGKIYPPAFLAASVLDLPTLRSSEDVAVDDLFSAVTLHGAPLLRANFPRAFLDVNREPYELDPKLFDQPPPDYANVRSLRVAGGLGTIARVVSEGRAIYGARIPLAEGLARIHAYYKPYHAALERLLNRTVEKFGIVCLIDCHSMPSRMPTGDARRPYEPVNADIVIGDRYGASCDPGFSHRVHALLSGMGYRVARNKPYAGGFITESYAARSRNRHALQIEINRALYLDEKTLELAAGYARLKADLTRLIAEIAPAAALTGGAGRQAAE